MEVQQLEIEAESLEAARRQAKAKVPDGQRLLSEEILSDGKERTARVVADSAPQALEEARKQVPEDAQVVSEKEPVPASRMTIEVEGFDEATARLAAKPKLGSNARIEQVVVKTEGKKGFLGMGKKPHLYQVTVFQPAVAEVRFKRRARIRVKIGETPDSGYCQACGRANSPAERSEKSIHFFCSKACSERYYKAKIGAILFSPNRFVINASGQDISGMMAAGRETAARATAYCWYCGRSVRMTENKCGSCGQEQDISL